MLIETEQEREEDDEIAGGLPKISSSSSVYRHMQSITAVQRLLLKT
jgi:hypothetical protein